MADKKSTPRHKRLYKDSPKLERGEDGNMSVSKNDKRGAEASDAEKATHGVQTGDDGKPDMEPYQEARIQEIKDMHTRHEKEMQSIHKRHRGEDAKKGDPEEKQGLGKEDIKEVDASERITG